MFVCGSPGYSIPPPGWGLALGSSMNWCIVVHFSWVAGPGDAQSCAPPEPSCLS